MDNYLSPAADYATANIAPVNANDRSISTNHSPPLPVLRDRPINEIIDGIYPTKVRYEQQYPPQFYPNAASPHIVTQPNVDNIEVAGLLSMQRGTVHSRTPSSSLLHRRDGNKRSTSSIDGFSVTGDLIHSFSSEKRAKMRH